MGHKEVNEQERQWAEAQRAVAHYRRLAELAGQQRLREAEAMSTLLERLREAERQVAHARDELERRVEARTADLQEANRRLQAEMEERSQVERELRQSQERLLQATSSSNTALWDWNLHTNEVYFSPIWKRQIGYRDDEIPNRFEEWEQRVHPEDLRPTKAKIQTLLDRGGPGFEVEFRFRHRNGSYRWIQAKASLLTDDQGRPHRLVGSHLDVTDQHNAREALRLSEEKYRGLVESLSDWIWQTDPQGRYTYASPRVHDLLGYTPDEVIGRTPFEFMPPAEADRVRAEYARLAQTKQPFAGLINVNLRKDGSLVVLETSGVPRLDARGGLLGYHGVDRDITERQRLEDERLQLERRMQQVQKLESLGVLAGGIAHDFNNLLTTILGNADLALEELPPASPLRTYLREIKDTSVRAADLCRQMLAYSGRGRFVIETISLREVVQEMLQLLRTSISRKAQFHLHLAEALPPLRGDATQLRQVVMNLVINASEALGDHCGSITVSTGVATCSTEELREGCQGGTLPAGRYVWLEVSDTGCGMDEATRQRAFEPFFTTKFTGRGLGLSAVLGIVRRHQGALLLRSQPGSGTTFRVLFPACPAASTPPPCTPQPAPPWSGTGTVLLVDDEEPVRTMGRRLLERLGFQVLLAADGREALHRFQEHRAQIDVVILDLTMPRLNGEETLAELRRLDPRVRVILSSGYTEAEMASRFSGAGLAGFMAKPYSKDELIRQLQTALAPPASPVH